MKKQNYRKIYLLCVALAFLLYGNTIKNDYALDDEFVVGDQSPAKQGIKGIPKIFTSYHAKDESGNEYEYRPMVKVSYAIEIELFGNNVHTHHFFNILYYAICLIVLFKMLLLLFEGYPLQNILWILLLFAFLPIHSEVVASLKNRDVMLSFIFSMLAFIFFLKWMASRQWWQIIIVGVMFLLALLSKFDALPLMAIFPLVYIQKTKIKNQSTPINQIVFNILLILIILLIMYIALKKGQKLLLNPITKQRVFNYFENPLYFDQSFIHRLITMFNSFGFYVMMLLLPIKMSCYYGYKVIPIDNLFNIYGIIGILSILILAYVFFKHFSKADILWYGTMILGLGISMFLNVVKPAPGIVADRFAFAPSVGWAMIMVYAIEYFNQKYLQKKKKWGTITQLNWWHTSPIKWYIIIYFTLCTVLIWYRNYEWRYKLYLYEADLKKYPESVKLHLLYASQIVLEIMQHSNKIDQNKQPEYLQIAMNEFNTAAHIDTTCGSCYNNIAFLYMNWLKNYDASIPYLLKSYRLDSNRKELLCNIAIAYFKTNRNKDTIEQFVYKAIRKDKDKTYEIPYEVMREHYIREKQYKKAIAFFENQLKERPRSEYLHYCLAEFYLLDRDTLHSIQTYEKLLSINPNLPKVSIFLSDLKNKYYHRK